MNINVRLVELEAQAAEIGGATEAVLTEVGEANEQVMAGYREAAPSLHAIAERESEIYRTTTGFDGYGDEELRVWRDGYMTALVAMQSIIVEKVPEPPQAS